MKQFFEINRINTLYSVYVTAFLDNYYPRIVVIIGHTKNGFYKGGFPVRLRSMTGILIIGGGIAGLSAAAALSSEAKVTLLEAEPHLGFHASGRSAAIYLSEYGNGVVRKLNHASKPELDHIDGGVLTKRGMLLLARPHERQDFLDEMRPFEMHEVSMAEARGLVPILHPVNTAFAAFRDNVYDLDADRLLQYYTKTARRNGAEIVTGSKVSGISKTSKGWEVLAGQTDHNADILINASGAWVDEIARMAGIAPLGFQPFRRSMARIPAPGGHDVSTWPFMDAVNERWYGKPDAGGWIVSPFDEHRMNPHDAWADDMVLAEGLERYSEMVTEPVTRLQSSWAGLRTFAPDRSLVVGADVADPSFYWLAGQGGYGFQTAPAASGLVADLILGRVPELGDDVVEALSPGRF